MKLSLADAIIALRPNSGYTLRGNVYSGLEWDSSNSDAKPTEEEVVRKLTELEYMDEINQYQRDRLVAYPSAGDQFDRIFHDGIEAWKADIQGIKNVYPRKYPDPVELKTRQDKAIEDLKSS